MRAMGSAEWQQEGNTEEQAPEGARQWLLTECRLLPSRRSVVAGRPGGGDVVDVERAAVVLALRDAQHLLGVARGPENVDGERRRRSHGRSPSNAGWSRRHDGSPASHCRPTTAALLHSADVSTARTVNDGRYGSGLRSDFRVDLCARAIHGPREDSRRGRSDDPAAGWCTSRCRARPAVDQRQPAGDRGHDLCGVVG
jgi:hypothetical protein